LIQTWFWSLSSPHHSFIEQIKPRAYSSVIRNLLYGALILNVTLLLLIYAILPSSTILTSSNILSLLASSAVPSSRWLRVLVVVDAAISLMGGVLCGGMSCCGLLEGLARDKVLPAAFLRKLPVTEGAWVSVMLYLFFCIGEWASQSNTRTGSWWLVLAQQSSTLPLVSL
jgi:amino acid transporter